MVGKRRTSGPFGRVRFAPEPRSHRGTVAVTFRCSSGFLRRAAISPREWQAALFTQKTRTSYMHGPIWVPYRVLSEAKRLPHLPCQDRQDIERSPPRNLLSNMLV